MGERARTAALHSLGCKVNAYETEAMRQLLMDAGYEIVPFSEPADVYIINTCSVTNVADKKSRQMLHRAKKKNPAALVVATGCYVQAAKEQLEKDLAVDVIIGNNRKRELVGILEQAFSGRNGTADSAAEDGLSAGAGAAAVGGLPAQADIRQTACRSWVSDIAAERGYEDLKLHRPENRTRAFIKVEDGCSQFCSYCMIPYTRGRVRSRRPADVLAEAGRLADAGCRELVLTGIHLSSYGTDFPKASGADLLFLIRRIHEIGGIERIRLGSLEPRIVTDDFAAALAGLPKVCPHFHLSLQSGCDATLKRMNRRYTAAEYAAGCARLRQVYDSPAITTDVIAGFPGETEEEFSRTKAFLAEMRFFEMHVFKYSRRRGTRADKMPDQVPEPVKARRSEELLELGRRLSADFRASFLGRQVQVLIEEGMAMNGILYGAGCTPEYLRVAVRDAANRKNQLKVGKISGFLTDEILLMEEN